MVRWKAASFFVSPEHTVKHSRVSSWLGKARKAGARQGPFFPRVLANVTS